MRIDNHLEAKHDKWYTQVGRGSMRPPEAIESHIATGAMAPFGNLRGYVLLVMGQGAHPAPDAIKAYYEEQQQQMKV